jgi:hydrogenase/urease accessory protein HupE
MALVPCPDCTCECSPQAHTCPACGRPLSGRTANGGWALELAGILALFGGASIAYALRFHETIIVTEERVKFWFGFQLVTLALACAAVGFWQRARAKRTDAAS